SALRPSATAPPLLTPSIERDGLPARRRAPDGHAVAQGRAPGRAVPEVWVPRWASANDKDSRRPVSLLLPVAGAISRRTGRRPAAKASAAHVASPRRHDGKAEGVGNL